MMDLAGITHDDLNSTYRDLADLIGLEATIAIFESFRGTQVTFPTRLISTSAVRRIVQEQSSVKSAKLLALELGYSERHVRQLISDTRSPRPPALSRGSISTKRNDHKKMKGSDPIED